MNTEKEIIFKLLTTIEGLIETDYEFSSEDLDDYITAAIYAYKHYGRKSDFVRQAVNDREGISIGDLQSAGLSYEDYKACYHDTEN